MSFYNRNKLIACALSNELWWLWILIVNFYANFQIDTKMASVNGPGQQNGIKLNNTPNLASSRTQEPNGKDTTTVEVPADEKSFKTLCKTNYDFKIIWNIVNHFA